MYVDSAYLAKFYLNEPESAAVRREMAKAHELVSSTWAVAEMTTVFHRKLREGAQLTQAFYGELIDGIPGTCRRSLLDVRAGNETGYSAK